MGASVKEGDSVLCVAAGVYQGALTRGRMYQVRALSADGRSLRVLADNGRTRWYPRDCFDLPGVRPLVTLASYRIDDPIGDEREDVEVTVELSDGTARWCRFATPAHFRGTGYELPATGQRVHFANRHVVVVEQLTPVVIEEVLRYLDAQGELIECTLAVDR